MHGISAHGALHHPTVGGAHPRALCVGKAVSGSPCTLYLRIVEGLGKGAVKEGPTVVLQTSKVPTASGN